ncbi:hypothetical protein QBC34DRAFT_115835 [Podospora aff. communis PSN243]|uniref:Uncharacterized protein n=1 Tax=Podospora aff. communis PSN243 TaxID=3040156 RepID=A0AAV9GNK4_9PEZI|nr:hypothetical protein QBC34DRAFT_115835 [Podospora aff. communis PSN243]
MAFHQPARHQQQRVVRVESEDGDSAILAPPARSEQNEPQTWVLFTPGTDAGTTASYLSSVQSDQLTPGRSRISDLGSLDTAARSDFNSQADNSAVPSEILEPDDDAELDSLDSHLSEFRSAPHHYAQQQGVAHTAPVFPRHDGLGSFRLDAPGASVEAQDRMYAFEQFNPSRVKRRKESFDLARLELENEEAQELERNRRIEAWRLEQSQLLLEDIRKETRRRRQSESSQQKAALGRHAAPGAAARSTVDEAGDEAHAAGTDWHEQDAIETSDAGRGLWSRITRRVLCDVMGIDDRLLAVLFGEVLPDDESASSTPKAGHMDSHSPAFSKLESESLGDSTWQLYMLERIAKELGQLVHRMSAHPGAFSTYARVQQMPLPYAGLPIIPEATPDSGEESQKVDGSVPSMPRFQPTVPQPVDIRSARSTETDTAQAFTQQEWEQDLDVRLVFRYLRSRFTPSRPAPAPFTSGTSHLATSSTQELAAKAARVRQHHPLVSHSHSHSHHRPRTAERRPFKVTTPSSPVALRHAGGSCASQSTRRSGRRSSVSSRHSSRHYWDIGGSIGTGSIIASVGPMGTWGEV